jgi:uncharacterized protein (DUF1697 family)
VTVHIALFRAINVGGHAKAAMSELREIFAALGFAGTQTLLRSGNVVFNAEVGRSGRELEALVARGHRSPQASTDIMIGTAQEWAAIIAS